MNLNKIAMRFLAATLLCGVSFSSTVSTKAQTLKLPPHEKVVLKNGMTVLLMEKRGVPIVSVAAIVKAGSVADPVGDEGLASITAGLSRSAFSACAGTAVTSVSRAARQREKMDWYIRA